MRDGVPLISAGQRPSPLPGPEGAPVCAAAQRARLAAGLRRYARKRTKWCRVKRVAPDVQVVRCYRPDGSARTVVHGVETCGSVHSCPLCAAAILTGRAAELTEALDNHERSKSALVTLTLRHHARLPLRLLRRLLAASYSRLKSGKGGLSLRRELGWLADVRASEVTHGGNGWHPHLHCLLFASADVDEVAWQERLGERWQRAVAAQLNRWISLSGELLRVEGAGTESERGRVLREFGAHYLESELALGIRRFRADAAELLAAPHSAVPDLEHGVDVQTLREGSRAAGQYLAKLGLEVASVTKTANGESRTAWQLAVGAAAGSKRDAALWCEYMAAMFGARQLTWSRGARDLLGLAPERPDEELAEETAGAEEAEELVAVIPSSVWDERVRSQSQLAGLYEAASSLEPGRYLERRLKFPREGVPVWWLRNLYEQQAAAHGKDLMAAKTAAWRALAKAREAKRYQQWFARIG